MSTANLGLPYIEAAQSQKHVTHNEALRLLDAVVQLAVASRSLTAPPASPTDGERWVVPAAGATGDWTGKANRIAARIDGAWTFLAPIAGWTAWVADEGLSLVFDGAIWGHGARSPHGASTGFVVIEEEVAVAGASTATSIAIPNRAIVLAVSTRTTQAVTGASAYDCGVSGETSKFGGSLGAAVGSTNIGVIGPTAFYANTPVVLTAVGGNFTGGKVRVAIHMLAFTAPSD